MADPEDEEGHSPGSFAHLSERTKFCILFFLAFEEQSFQLPMDALTCAAESHGTSVQPVSRLWKQVVSGELAYDIVTKSRHAGNCNVPKLTDNEIIILIQAVDPFTP